MRHRLIKNLYFIITYGLVFIVSCTFISCTKKKGVLITGTVYFEDYEQGVIHVAAFNSFLDIIDHNIGYTEIAGPGSYKLYLPDKQIGDTVLIAAYNDIDNDGPPRQRHDPHTIALPLKRGLVTLHAEKVTGIDINFDRELHTLPEVL